MQKLNDYRYGGKENIMVGPGELEASLETLRNPVDSQGKPLPKGSIGRTLRNPPKQKTGQSEQG